MPQLLVNALIAGSIYAIVSSGFSLMYGVLKVLNFAHGQVLMLGAYLFYFFHISQELAVPAAGILSLGCMSLFAITALRLFIEPFTEHSFILPLVSTLALSIILESLVSIFFGVNVKSFTSGSAVESIEFWGIFITPIQIIIITSAVFILSVLGLVVHTTYYGRMLRALAEHPAAAESLGINRRILTLSVILIGTLLATYAGILVGYETNIQPTMGGIFTVKALAAMILGGLGNIWGTVAGSYILALVENLGLGVEIGGYSIPAGYKDAVAFIIILLMLLVRPTGIFGKRLRKV